MLHLGEAALSTLRAHRDRQTFRLGRVPADGAFVFTTRDGSPLDSRNVTRDLQAALENLGLPRQRFHDLRHAYATLMIEAGEDLAVVSRSLGHSTISTTADVYAHLTPAIQKRAASRMDAILGHPEAAATG